MNNKIAAVAIVSCVLGLPPFAPAYADGWGHHRGGNGLVIAGAAITGAALALVTLPFTRVEDIAAPPQPVYAAPAPVYYAPAYYYPPGVVYAYPQPYPRVTYSYPYE